MGIAQSAIFLIASALAGMLGIGVGFAAVPLMSFTYADMAHQIEPLALLLNGISALFAAFAFAAARLVPWRRTAVLAGVCTVCTPLGAMASHFAPDAFLWSVYMVAMVVAIVQLLRPATTHAQADRFPAALPWAVPISIVSGLVGVGPGFLLVPAMIAFGVAPRTAAAMNSVAVVPASFAGFAAHSRDMNLQLADVTVPALLTAFGAAAGAALAGRFASDRALRRVFVAILAGVCLYRGVTLVVSMAPAPPSAGAATGATLHDRGHGFADRHAG